MTQNDSETFVVLEILKDVFANKIFLSPSPHRERHLGVAVYGIVVPLKKVGSQNSLGTGPSWKLVPGSLLRDPLGSKVFLESVLYLKTDLPFPAGLLIAHEG